MSMASLPEEIFIEIVEIMVHPHNDLRALRLNTLRLVCRRWDEWIQQTPSLWTYVWNGNNNTYVERALQRSEPLGLKVRVSYWPKVKNRDTERFWSALLPHVDRWEHAELSGKLGDSIPHALALKGASRLRSLALDSNSRKYETIYGPFPWSLPNLESLRIHNIGVPWSPQQHPLARLKYLYINLHQTEGGYGYPDPLLMDILDSLRECQELVSLHLTGMRVSSDIPKETLTPISLPNLEFISIGSLPESVECKLLETIRIPKCRLIVIRPWSGAWSIDQLLETLDNLAGHIGTATIPNYAIVEAQESDYEAYLDCDLRAVDGGGSFMRLRLGVSDHLPWDEFLQEAVPFFHRWVKSFGPNNGWNVRIATFSLEYTAGILSAFATHFLMALTLTITNWITNSSWFPDASLIALFDPEERAVPCLEQLELWYCKAFVGDIILIIANRMIREGTLGGVISPLRMRIKLPKDMDEVERVDLAWLEDQLPNLTLQETTVVLNE
ncbi:hypothetical protein FRC00_011975 [Tulasnella sp. 408]|nr:hypothetical protein FRC00_011975 [Tulasnella sp. 408]